MVEAKVRPQIPHWSRLKLEGGSPDPWVSMENEGCTLESLFCGGNLKPELLMISRDGSDVEIVTGVDGSSRRLHLRFPEKEADVSGDFPPEDKSNGFWQYEGSLQFGAMEGKLLLIFPHRFGNSATRVGIPSKSVSFMKYNKDDLDEISP